MRHQESSTAHGECVGVDILAMLCSKLYLLPTKNSTLSLFFQPLAQEEPNAPLHVSSQKNDFSY